MKTNYQFNTVYIFPIEEKKKIKSLVEEQAKQQKSFVSFADTCDLFCFVISDERIGLDVEEARKRLKDHQELVDRFFHEEEKIKLENDVEFYVMWTRKEAIFKAVNSQKKNMFSFKVLCHEQEVDGIKYYLYTTSIVRKDKVPFIISVASTKKELNPKLKIDDKLVI